MVLIWILKYLSVKTVGNEVIWSVCIEFREQNVSNVMALTKLSITANSCSVAKLMKRLILLGSKPSRESLVPTPSNVQTARVNIKQTPLIVHSGNIGSIKNSILKNMQKFKKIENNQFVQLWMVTRYDYQRLKNFFTKCSKKQSYSEYYSWIQYEIWYYFYSRTIVVNHSFYI